MAATYIPIVSAAQLERDARRERAITQAGLDLVMANTSKDREAIWGRMRELIVGRSVSQILRMETKIGIANLRAAAVPLHFRSARVAA